ncbi:MAG: VWA domain-containing protein [Acidobacteria bacterium]|nr:VWA domain-containing protein [Acidobacteriota bacterium]
MNSLRGLLAVFATPYALLAGAGAALVLGVLLFWAARRRAARAAALVSPELAAKARLAPPPSTPALAAVLAVLVAISLGAAFARPHWGDTQERAERRGADVVLVLDTSASMRAADVSPSRFALARQAAQSLVARLGSDRVALVSCEGDAQALVPLTLDAAAVGLFLDAIEPGMGAKPGTSVAAGIAAAAELFPPGVGGGRHLVFFSDGEDLEGGVDAAIGRAKAEGITIHAVFVGATSGTGAPVPEVDAAGRTSGYKSDAGGQPVLSKPDPELLRRLAAGTGGSYTAVSSLRTDLEGVARQIDLGARRPMSEVLLTMREERFQFPLGVAVAALGLLLLGVGAGKKRRFLRKVRGAGAAATATLLVMGAALRAAAQSAPAVPVSAAPQQAAPSPSSPSKSSSSSSDPAAATSGSPEEPASLPLSKKIFSSPRSSAQKGQKALDEKKTDEALTHFQEEIALDPKDPTGAYNLGTAQSKAGRVPEALASLEKARKEGRGALAADAAFNEGQALFREKQYEKAAAAFRDALRRRPSDADAAWNYELCVRRAEEQKKQQEQQKRDQQKKDDQKDKKSSQGKDDKQKQDPQAGGKDEEKRRQDRDFEQKANMSREKAEQLLSAIERSDLEEQKKKIAEQRGRRKVARDW